MARNVVIDIKAKTAQYERALRGATTSTKGLGASISNLGTKAALAGVAGVAIGVGAIGAAAVKVGIESATAFAAFETSLSQIEGLVGVAHDEVVAFGDSVKELAVKTAKPAQELAEALFFITSAGLEGETALDALEVSAKAASAGLGDTVVVADLVTSAMNAYGPATLDAAAATDVLVATVREGKAAAPELAGSMGRVIPIASQLGVSFDQVGAAIAAMTRVGLNANEAATALNGILNSLLKPTGDAEKAMAELGLSSAELRTELAEKGLFATLTHLNDAFDGQTEATARVFGNVRALTGVLSLMGSNAETTGEIFDSLAGSTGALDTAFDVASKTGAFAFEQAKTEISNALLEIGSDILPKLADSLTDMMPKIKELILQIGDLSIAMVDFGVAAVPAVLNAFTTIETAMLNFQIGMLEVKKGVEDFNNVADVLMGPWLNIPDAFNDADQALQTWLLSQREINRELAMGSEPIDLAARALNHLAEAGALTAERMDGVQSQIGLTTLEMFQAAEAAHLYGRTTARTVEEVAMMEKALKDLKDLAKGELIASMREVGGANEYLGSSAGAASRGMAGEEEAIEDLLPPLSELETHLLAALDAQESLADAMLAAADPTFKAVKAVEGLAKAEEALATMEKEGKSTAEELAAAQLAIVEATYKAQGALDAVDPLAMEAALAAITTALGLSDEEAQELLRTLGILDGTEVSTVVEVNTQFTTTGSPTKYSGGALDDYDFRASGGPVEAGHPYVVGERGRELFVPDTSGTIMPSGSFGGDTTNQFNLNVYGSTRPDQDAQTVLLAAHLIGAM